MAANYTYEPTKITEGGKDQMRFELGDTVTDNGPMTCVLCDEEYQAIIDKTKNWKRAKLKCLEAIVMKLAYDVNTSVDGLSYSFNDRAKRWWDMYNQLKDELKVPAIPVAAPGSVYKRDEPHYFRKNLHMNIAKY